MGPLVWDLAHIAAYEDLWLCHRACGLDLLRPDLAELYDAFETPRAQRADDDSGFLKTRDAYAYMEAVHERAREGLEHARTVDDTLLELVLRHELQHTETMRQTMNIAGLLPDGEPPVLAVERQGTEEWLRVAAGSFDMGADAPGFAYDNERPRHAVSVAAFEIAREPLTNAAWAHFCEEGGYERRELWSEEGWRWLSSQSQRSPAWASREDPVACLCHVTWYEAVALARANGAGLPTEAEWEKAARTGELADTGLAWEWTSSEFRGYPGFRAHPYREYSEVFFDRGYRVLRGSSWATHERVASVTFRNWDLPERAQIFAGVRLAREAS